MLEILIIIALVLLNGVFALSEAAVIASRRARLQQMAERGDRGARAALKLVEDPNRFLSTVQIGITLIGILAGVFGGATVAGQLAALLRRVPALSSIADPLSYFLIVLLTTYLSLIMGELVPKRLALRSPEKVASLIAIPMRTLSKLTSPVVTVLGASTDAVLRVLGARPLDEPPVTEAEITTMIEQGVEAGVFYQTEHEMVEGVFRLADSRIRHVMSPRHEIAWLDINAPIEETKQRIIEADWTRFPVCEGDIDHVLGIVNARDILARAFRNEPFDLRAIMQEPLFLPETMLAGDALEIFKKTGHQMALVLGEYGTVEGVLTIRDLVEEIVGDPDKVQPVLREDGSWLLDGMTNIEELKEVLQIDETIPGEHDHFDTLGGFVMAQLGRVPAPADRFRWGRFEFEVVDMDGRRVDKVLVTTLAGSAHEMQEQASEVE
ncbi:MAG: hemolysin family protein [Chloroflexota bacterium]|nr:MAG: hypothetical protein DIU68_17625 [Chloroflexota bacterium]